VPLANTPSETHRGGHAAKNAHKGTHENTTAGDLEQVWNDPSIWRIWLIYMRDMTDLYVWRDACMHAGDLAQVWHVIWLLHVCDMPHSNIYAMTHSCVWHASFIHVTWLIHTCDRLSSCKYRGAFICVTSLIHICGMTLSHKWQNSFIRVTCHVRTCGMANSYVWPAVYVWHDVYCCATWLIRVFDITQRLGSGFCLVEGWGKRKRGLKNSTCLSSRVIAFLRV